MALVQGIYDLGEPGREAKPIDTQTFADDRSNDLNLSLNHRNSIRTDDMQALHHCMLRIAESQYPVVRSSGALYAGFLQREMLRRDARCLQLKQFRCQRQRSHHRNAVRTAHVACSCASSTFRRRRAPLLQAARLRFPASRRADTAAPRMDTSICLVVMHFLRGGVTLPCISPLRVLMRDRAHRAQADPVGCPVRVRGFCTRQFFEDRVQAHLRVVDFRRQRVALRLQCVAFFAHLREFALRVASLRHATVRVALRARAALDCGVR